MSKIPDPAEECQSKARPTANNSAASTESAHNNESTSDRGGEQNSEILGDRGGKSHCFCPLLAKEHGEETAAILQGLGHKISGSKKIVGGRKWHYDTLEALEKRWPYLSDSGIHGIIQRQVLVGNVFKGSFNKLTFDRTTWYSMPDTLLSRAIESDGKMWFDVNVAVKCRSIIAGTLYQNLRFHLLKFLAENCNFADTPFHKVNKAALARVLPWSLSTIKREYRELLKQGLIAENPKCSGEYTICSASDLVVPIGIQRKFGNPSRKSGSSAEMGIGSSTENIGSSVEQNGSSTDESVSSTENNTHYKPFEKTIYKNHSLTAPPTVGGSCMFAADAAHGANEKDTTSNIGSSTMNVEENVANAPIAFRSLLDIRQHINSITPLVPAHEQELIAKLVPSFCDLFMSILPFDIHMLSWSGANSPDAIRAVSPLLWSDICEDQANRHYSLQAAELCFSRCLEIIVGALVIYDENDTLLDTKLKHCRDEVQNAFECIPNITERTDCSASARASLLVRQIKAYNKDGWPTYSNGDVSFYVADSKTTESEATAFFEEHSDMSAHNVWSVLADCVEVFKLNIPPQAYDPLWHARKGVKPKYLFNHLSDIKAELAMTTTLAS